MAQQTRVEKILKVRMALQVNDETFTEFSGFEPQRAADEGWYMELPVTMSSFGGPETSVVAQIWIDGREGFPPGWPGE